MSDLAGLKPAISFLKVTEDGVPYLAGSRCEKCGETFLGTRDICAHCFARNQMKPVKLSERGKLYNFTVVHRAFPGVKVPFVSAIVDLDGGGTVKGTLLDVEPDPKKIKFDMLVKTVFREAGRTDKAGNRYLAYFFVPENVN